MAQSDFAEKMSRAQERILRKLENSPVMECNMVRTSNGHLPGKRVGIHYLV